jgi:hypothetical protein
MSRLVDWYILADVSKERNALIFKVKLLDHEDDGPRIFRRVGKYL